MTHVARLGSQFHRCGHFVRVTLAESRVLFVGLPSGRGDGRLRESNRDAGRSGRLPSRRPWFLHKPCWHREEGFVINGINARSIRPSHGCQAWTKELCWRSSARQPHLDTRSRFQRRGHPTHHLFQPSNQRGPVVQIKPLSKFDTLVLVPFSGKSAR